jgi:hypothetical protein
VDSTCISKQYVNGHWFYVYRSQQENCHLLSSVYCKNVSPVEKIKTFLGESTKYTNIKSTTVYVPSSELGLSHPLSRQRVCPSLQNLEGGTLRVRGWVECQFRRLEKKLRTLPTLWVSPCLLKTFSMKICLLRL